MEYEKLEKYISILSDQHKKVNQIYKLGVDIIDFTDQYHTLFKMLWGEILTPEGLDWLEWFIWDKGAIEGEIKEEIGAWDEDGNPICQDLKGLYEYLNANNYFKVNS
jgi:hypothetical protein